LVISQLSAIWAVDRVEARWKHCSAIRLGGPRCGERMLSILAYVC